MDEESALEHIPGQRVIIKAPEIIETASNSWISKQQVQISSQRH